MFANTQRQGGHEASLREAGRQSTSSSWQGGLHLHPLPTSDNVSYVRFEVWFFPGNTASGLWHRKMATFPYGRLPPPTNAFRVKPRSWYEPQIAGPKTRKNQRAKPLANGAPYSSKKDMLRQHVTGPNASKILA